jgi:hypothetical protein
LQAADLDARMASVWQALDAVGHDPELRAALEEWAAAPDDRELAWTAHVILDLAEHRVRSNATPTLPFGGSLFDDPFPQLPFIQAPNFGGSPFDAFFRDRLQPGQGGGTFERKQSSFEVTPDGVKLHIETTGPDGTQTETFEAETMEELKAAHPELFEQGGLVPRMQVGERFGLLPKAAAPGAGPGFDLTPGQLRTDILGVLVGAGADVDGLIVQRVFPGTIAAELGLGIGDTIVRINERKVSGVEDIQAELAARSADGALEVEWVGPRGTHHTATWKP